LVGEAAIRRQAHDSIIRDRVRNQSLPQLFPIPFGSSVALSTASVAAFPFLDIFVLPDLTPRFLMIAGFVTVTGLAIFLRNKLG
jgi:hypothetical protein